VLLWGKVLSLKIFVVGSFQSGEGHMCFQYFIFPCFLVYNWYGGPKLERDAVPVTMQFRLLQLFWGAFFSMKPWEIQSRECSTPHA